MKLRNPDALDFSYIPRKMFFRERQVSTLMANVLTPLRMGITSNLALFGSSGTGKTSTVRFILREEKGFTGIYENALSYSSLRALMTDVLSRVGKIVQKNLGFPEIFRSLDRTLRAKQTNLLLVVDEATNLLKFDRAGLYNILRAHELYGCPMSTVIISMEDPSIYMTERERKSLGVFSTVLFDRYTRDELSRIVEDRAALAMSPEDIDPSVIEYICDLAEPFGSARVAIELLQKATYMCLYRNGESVSLEDARGARSMISPYVTESKLGELDRDELAVLLAICRSLRDDPSTSIADVIAEMGSVCEETGTEIMDQGKVYRIVRRLENTGLVEGKIVGKGDRKGVGKMLGVNDIPVSVLEEKVTEILRRKR